MAPPHSTSKRFRAIGTLLTPHAAAAPAATRQPSSLDHLGLGPTAVGRVQQHDAMMRSTADVATAAYLCALAAALLRLMFAGRDRTDPLLRRHICAAFKSDMEVDGLVSARVYEDFDSHARNWLRTIRGRPEMRTHVIDTAVDVHTGGRGAQSWCFKRVSGLPGGICKESVAIKTWELQGDTWVMTGVNIVGGVSAFE